MRILDQLKREPTGLPLVLLIPSNAVQETHTGASPSAAKGQDNKHSESRVTQNYARKAGIGNFHARSPAAPFQPAPWKKEPKQPSGTKAGTARPGCPRLSRESKSTGGAAWRTPAGTLWRGERAIPAPRSRAERQGPDLTVPLPYAGQVHHPSPTAGAGPSPCGVTLDVGRAGSSTHAPQPAWLLCPRRAVSTRGAPRPPTRLTGISAARMWRTHNRKCLAL